MDRLNQLRRAAGGSGDSTLDSSSPPSEAYLTANDSQSTKFFSLSEVDSSFDISPIKDVSFSQATVESETTITGDELGPSPSPSRKKSDMLEGYKIGKQTEAANVQSGAGNIFDDNDNSYDGDELVIDDNVERDEKPNSELKQADPAVMEATLLEEGTSVASKDPEVVLQIDGKNVDAIDIGNGLYLYRKDGEEELAAVQIIDDDKQQPSFKFLKVRENVEGNLEVYEEIEIEVPKEVPTKEINSGDKNTTHVPTRDINVVINDPTSNKVADNTKSPEKVSQTALSCDVECELKDGFESKLEVNGKLKFSESRKSPVIGSFTYHSTPNKEGKPLTKTMVDLQLHPSRHSDNVKKTIEVHTDSCKQKNVENDMKCKDLAEENVSDALSYRKDETAVVFEEKREDNLNPIKISNDKTVRDDTSKKIFAAPFVRDKVVKSIPAASEYLEKTDKNINGDVKKSDNNISASQDSSESTVKVVALDDNNVKVAPNDHSQDNTIKSIALENNSTTVPDVLDQKLTKDEHSEKQLFSKIEQVNDNNKQENVVTHIEKQTDDDILNNKVALLESYLDNDKKFSVPKENETINLNQKENVKENIVLSDRHVSKMKNILHGTKEMPDMTPVDKTESTLVLCKDDVKVLTENIPNSDYLCKSNSLGNNIEIGNKDINYDKSLKSDETKTFLQPNVEFGLEQTQFNLKNEQIDRLENQKLITDSKNITEQKLDKDELLDVKDNYKEELKQNLSEDQHLDNDSVEIIANTFIPSESIKKLDEKTESQKANKLIELPNETDSIKESENIKNELEKTEDAKSNNPGVPFGKWTDVNTQEFLIKLKGFKMHTHANSSNNNTIKSSNDLNRRDILKKIDSQRQSSSAASKIQELSRINSRAETVFATTSAAEIEESEIADTVVEACKVPIKIKPSSSKLEEIPLEMSSKQDTGEKTLDMSVKVTSTVTGVTHKESVQRKAVKDLIDKTIEGMINKAFPSKSVSADSIINPTQDSETKSLPINPPALLDAIEETMNELHGIPFIERPPHELPKVYNPVPNSCTNTEQDCAKSKKSSKVPNLLICTNKNPIKIINDSSGGINADFEEEIIEHEPVTGDVEIKQDLPSKPTSNEKSITESEHFNLGKDFSKKENIITENDFDKFARRNSVTYENCLTINFEEKESHNVVKTVIEKDKSPKKVIKNEISQGTFRNKIPVKYQNLPPKVPTNKNMTSTKLGIITEDPSNKRYQSKLQIAYQSALTSKRQLSNPITIIEDQPVKVVFMDAKTNFVPNLLNVQGQELAPSIKQNTQDSTNSSMVESVNSDIMGTVNDGKLQDDIKLKTKHQRKQVLTPVEIPELELIEPSDLGIEVSPKKKRKIEEIKLDKAHKNVIHKKSYLLGRTGIEDKTEKNAINDPQPSIKRDEDIILNKNPVTALDNLVKAVELVENQSENLNISNVSNPETLQNTTPFKRGRGRPRKYPIPDGTADKTRVPTPQKKLRLIDAKPNKYESVTDDDDDDDSTDDGIVKENWTMGKINENIVCPICNKLFRSENVVFKHVKHCTGPSPNRSEASNRSVRRDGDSQESDEKSQGSKDDMEVDEDKALVNIEKKHKKLNFREMISKSKGKEKQVVTENIVDKEKPKTRNEGHELKLHDNKSTSIKNKSWNNLNCDYCGKTFRQPSYLAHHKLQHKKDVSKIVEKKYEQQDKSIFSCDICKKIFRKLHHLVQHRLIHNPNSLPVKSLSKNSTEQLIGNSKNRETCKQSEDASAGFRCEPCDKSFRKLHHLVEHRETHDGISRQKVTCPDQTASELTIPPPQCDLCKKIFRKLHHLIEHKEQHVETSSEKSDDKSVKSSLSTKDIIHECSLCYMVFPNEHSLNKHTVICQRKKRQSKQPKPVNKEEIDTAISTKLEESKSDDGEEPEIILNEVKIINLDKDDDTNDPVIRLPVSALPEDNTNTAEIVKNTAPIDVEEEKIKTQGTPIIIDEVITNVTNVIITRDKAEIAEKVKKISGTELNAIKNGAKKKIAPKDKVSPSVTKRQKTFNRTLPTVDENKPLVESSDDDEVRYMFNPDYKPDDLADKLFMKVRAKKRNSLQIERPNSKGLVTRRTSLQHPPKTPRFKPKPIEAQMIPSTLKDIPKIPKVDSIPSTDSDDSDVKYSFPVKTIAEESPKSGQDGPQKVEDRRSQRKSLELKRKSLSGIAKRKSLGKSIGSRLKMKQSPAKQVRKRPMTVVQHRCDCGQLFSSAALLSRHTSLDHTPPRIRKRRSPPPEIEVKPTIKPVLKLPEKTNPATTRKSSVRNETNLNTKTTKSTDAKPSRKSTKPAEKAKIVSPKNGLGKTCKSAHKGVPVPEKMRKLKEKGALRSDSVLP